MTNEAMELLLRTLAEDLKEENLNAFADTETKHRPLSLDHKIRRLIRGKNGDG